MRQRNPKIGVLVDFANCAPGAQTRIVEGQRRMYLDDGRLPWAYYGPMTHAIRRAIADPDPESVLQAVVDNVGDPAKKAHYEALRDGCLKWLGKSSYSLVPAPTARWVRSGVTFEVVPQLGLRPAKGPNLAVLLYMKEPELRPEAVNIPLHMVRQVLPGMEPAILDVRRGSLRRLSTNRSLKRLDADVAGVVAHWSAIWQAIA